MSIKRILFLPARAFLGILCGILTLVAVASFAQSTEQGDAAAQPQVAPASSPGSSVMNSIGSFFNRMRAPTASEPQSGNSGEAQATPPVADVSSASAGSTFNIIDIESWSKTSNVVLDPQCKVMAQPFGIGDNAASLILLAAKLKLKSFLDGMQGEKAQPLKVADVTKLAARNLNWLPMDVELQLGASMLPDADILDENKNADSRKMYQLARATLADIVKDIAVPLPYDFQVQVRTMSFGNASALPGGIILVDRDLFKKGFDPDHTYFVMAHEVSHVLQRHQTRMYQARLADGIDSLEGLKQLMGGAAKADPANLVAYGAALKRLFINFSEQQELQADSCAMRLMAKRFPEQKLMAAKLNRIQQHLGPVVPVVAENPQGNLLVENVKYLGDGVMERHPNTLQRRANLEATFKIVYVSK